MIKGVIRAVLDGVALAVTFPLALMQRAHLVKFATVSQALAPIPGQLGRFIRRGWYRQTLTSCGKHLTVEWGAAFRTAKASVGDNCLIGVGSWIGWAEIGDNFLGASHVIVLSGSRQHRVDRLDIPMVEQGGDPTCVRIGDDVWAGTRATIMSDVAPHSVVAACALVTKHYDEYDILVGSPAKPRGNRRQLAGRAGTPNGDRAGASVS